ncbi:MAG TPA: A24 family peptidase [Xanthomonadaceae bacterium]|jgi:leader peptidase (prepilin peptidase)/N-methyltransferase
MIELLLQPAWMVGCTFLFGLLIGSFLNVVILRIPARLEWQWRRDSRDMLGLPDADSADGESAVELAPPGIVVERSFCPKCHHQLSALDNIPVVSWLSLGGRCRYCKAPISMQYPAVELLTAVASAGVVWHFGPHWESAAALVFTWFLVALSGIDLRTTLLPDQLTYPLLWIGLLASTLGLFADPVSALWGAAAGYLSLWSVFWGFKLLTGKEGMGRGDFKLLAALGAWCGIKGVFPIVLISALLGAVIGSAWLMLRGRDRATPIPFGPYLAAAGWVQLLWGPYLIDTYLRLSGMR